MSANTLDRIDGAREYLAELIVAKATLAQMVDAFKVKFGESVTPRSVSKWKNHDAKLTAAVERLQRGDEPADAEVADAADAALKRMLLDEPDKLSADQLLRIKRELGGSSSGKSAAAMIRDDTPAVAPVVMEYLFFSLTADYGEEGYHFGDVLAADGSTLDDVCAALPAAADVAEIMAEGEARFLNGDNAADDDILPGL